MSMTDAVSDHLALVNDHKADLRRKQVREATQRLRARQKRGQFRRTLNVSTTQLRRLVELGYLRQAGLPVAEVTALEAFLFDELQAI